MATAHSATITRFSLLRGYSLGNFYKQPEGMLTVSAQHSHFVSEPSRVINFPAPEKIT